MSLYYNQGSPNKNSKNSINSIMSTLPNIRDFLLLKNLSPQYPQKLGMLPSPKIGQPVLDTMVGNGSNLLPIGLPLETEGVLWKEQNILPNTFKNVETTANDLVSINYIQNIPYVSQNGLFSFGNAEWPNGIQRYPTGANDEVKKYGIFGKTVNAKFKNNNTAKNLYLDVDKQIDIADFINLQPVDSTQQIKGYLDTYGSLNLGDNNISQTANIIGSITNGQGLGLSKGGVVPNFDLKASLAGRVLGATGLLKDTKLGQIGGQQLALALANNAAFNLQQDILGSLNIQDNILSLVKGQGFAGFPRPNYNITIPESGLGRIADYTSKVLGFTVPRSYMTQAGSIFQSESGEVGNIERANALLKTTGNGQIQALLANINANINGTDPSGTDNPNNSLNHFRSGYAPAFKNNKGNDIISNTKLYAFSTTGDSIINLFSKSDGVISDLSYLREEQVTGRDGYGFKDPTQLEFVGHFSNKGYDDRLISDVAFSWGSYDGGSGGKVNSNNDYSDITGNRKSLLVKTQKLFNSVGMLNIVTAKGDMNKNSSQITQANGKGFSKGNAVMSADMFGYTNPQTGEKSSPGEWNKIAKTADETYCRSWTTIGRYDSISKLVRNDSLYTKDSGKLPFRFNTENSVLEDTGFVHIAPYTNDFLNKDVPRNVKNYMLSIENLAWFDRKEMLPKGELGPGDPITGKQGRIMWFPPYDIQFSESTSVDWESHKFIGRGENMYTYNNTERAGQLSFKIIVDHSTYTNTFRGETGPDDHYVASFMAGCIEPDSIWTDKFTTSQITKTITTITEKPQEKVAPPEEIPPGDMFVFFPNDQAETPALYECGVSGSTSGNPNFDEYIDYEVYNSSSYSGDSYGLKSYPSNFTYKTECVNNNGIHREWPDNHNYGLNFSYSGGTGAAPITTVGDSFFKGFYSPQAIILISEYINQKCPHCVIEVTGYASPQGREECNIQLANERADRVVENLRTEWANFIGWTPEQAKSRIKKMKSEPVKEKDSKCKVCPKNVKEKDRNTLCPTDTLGCKLDRKVKIHFRYDASAALEEFSEPPPTYEMDKKDITTKITQKFYNETMFFDKLKKTDKFIFDRFRDKIKYFHPSFHSTTPEGLNSRLTFLQQCTRQGPTDTQTTNNLAFGRAPICILRVGDFFNTKIIIDSLNIDYEPLVWDLNPEGIGVQPMIANVSLSFKFIGGESLYGPINKLQNALSFNYYANTGVYEARADFISDKKPTSNTPDSSTGMYLNNGVISTKEDPIIETFETDQAKNNEREIDQVKANEQPASVQETPISSSSEPKIIGFKNVDILSISESKTKKIVNITLKSENIINKDDVKLITDEELKKLLTKGVKLSIERSPTPSNSSRYEEIVKLDGIERKDPWRLFTYAYALGEIPEMGTFVIELPEYGNYTLSVFYNNEKIQSVPVIISADGNYEKNY